MYHAMCLVAWSLCCAWGLLLPALRSPFILSKAKQDQSSHQSTNFLCFLSQAVMSCRAVNSVIEQIGHSNENLMKNWLSEILVFLWFLHILRTPQLTQLPSLLYISFLHLWNIFHVVALPFFSLPFSVSFHSPSQVSALPRTRSARAASTASAVTTKLLSGRGAEDHARRTWRRHPESERRQKKIAQKQGDGAAEASEQLKWLVSGMVGIVVFGVAWLAHKLLTTSKGTKVIPLIPRGDKFKKELTSVPTDTDSNVYSCILVPYDFFWWIKNGLGVTSSAVSDKSDKSDKPDKYWMISKKLIWGNREDLQAAQRRCLCLGPPVFTTGSRPTRQRPKFREFQKDA